MNTQKQIYELFRSWYIYYCIGWLVWKLYFINELHLLTVGLVPANMTEVLSSTSPCLTLSGNRFIPGWNPSHVNVALNFNPDWKTFRVDESPPNIKPATFYPLFIALNQIKTFVAATTVHISVVPMLRYRSAATRPDILPVADAICLLVNSYEIRLFFPGQRSDSLTLSFYELHSLPWVVKEHATHSHLLMPVWKRQKQTF